MRTISNLLLAHVNAIVFVVGFAVCYAGVAGAWSFAIANVAAGAALMLGAAWPYLCLTLKRAR